MTPHDKLAAAMLIVLLAIAATVIVFAANDPTAFESAKPHPRYSAMQVGGEAGERDEQYWWIGWLVGSLMFAFLGGLMWFGFLGSDCGDKSNANKLRRRLAGGMLTLLIVFALGCFSYRQFGITGQPFVNTIAPTATKTLIFGVWAVPFWFTALYVLGFDKWFYPSKSIESGTITDESSDNDLERG